MAVQLSTLCALASDSTLASGATVDHAEHNTHRTNYRTLINNQLTALRDIESNYAAASAPADTPDGKLWYDSGNTLMKARISSAWETLVDTTLTQTLTNKTLTAPVLGGTVTGTYTLGGTPSIVAGATFATGGTATHKPMGVIHVNTTEVGNVGSGSDDLMSYTLPANTLDANGKILRVTALFKGNGSDNVELYFHFGSTSIGIDSGGPYGTASGDVSVTCLIVRTGATAQILNTHLLDGSTSDQNEASATETLSGTVVVKFAGRNETDTSDNAIVQQLMLVEALN